MKQWHALPARLLAVALIALLYACNSSSSGSGSSGGSDNKDSSGDGAPFTVSDPLFPQQWYIANDGSSDKCPGCKKGIDINLLPVWEKGYKGNNVKVGVIDYPFDATHPDLRDNLADANNFDWASPQNYCDPHGNRVMGIIGARDNTIGIRGIAPRVTLYGFGIAGQGLTRQKLTENVRRAFIDYPDLVAYNIAIGSSIEHLYNYLSDDLHSYLDAAITSGAGNKGASVVVSAGNTRQGGNASNTLMTNHFGVIGVNAIASNGQWPLIALSTAGGGFSYGHTVGTNIWITAPAGGISLSHTGCGDSSGYSTIGGTSGAAPMVTGVVALLRAAYPNLTWRDVKLILAESARKILPDKTMGAGWNSLARASASGYQDSGVMYHDSTKKQQYHRLSGFGLIDAKGAFDLADRWTNLPPYAVERTSSGNISIDTIVDVTADVTLNLSSKLTFIEAVALYMELTLIDGTGDVDIFTLLTLTSPDGTTAQFYDASGDLSRTDVLGNGKALYAKELATIPGSSANRKDTKLRLLTNRFLGNGQTSGAWTLRMKQLPGSGVKRINSWSITLYGH